MITDEVPDYNSGTITTSYFMVNARTNVDKLVEELSLRPRNEQKSLLFTVHLDKPSYRVLRKKP